MRRMLPGMEDGQGSSRKAHGVLEDVGFVDSPTVPLNRPSRSSSTSSNGSTPGGVKSATSSPLLRSYDEPSVDEPSRSFSAMSRRKHQPSTGSGRRVVEDVVRRRQKSSWSCCGALAGLKSGRSLYFLMLLMLPLTLWMIYRTSLFLSSQSSFPGTALKNSVGEVSRNAIMLHSSDYKMHQVFLETSLVSIIIVTQERPTCLARALLYISRQTYRRIEVVIYDGSDVAVDTSLWEAEGYHFPIIYVHNNESVSIGTRRNRANAYARGEILMHWDDDDLYRPLRIELQVRPIIMGLADLSVFEHMLHYYTDASGLLSPAEIAEKKRLFADKQAKKMRLQNSSQVSMIPGVFVQVKWPCFWGPHFGTLAYRKDLWVMEKFRPFSLGEDYGFSARVLNKGHRMHIVKNIDGTFVYVRHKHNSWQWQLPPAAVMRWDKNNVEVIRTREILAVPTPSWFTDDDEAFYSDLVLSQQQNSQQGMQMKERKKPPNFKEDPDIDHKAPGLLPCFIATPKDYPHSPSCCEQYYTTNATLPGIVAPNFYFKESIAAVPGPFLVIGMNVPIYDSSGASVRLLALLEGLLRLGATIHFVPVIPDHYSVRQYHIDYLQNTMGIKIYQNHEVAAILRTNGYEAVIFHQFYWKFPDPSPFARHHRSMKKYAPTAALVVLTDDLHSERMFSVIETRGGKESQAERKKKQLMAGQIATDEYGTFHAADLVVVITEEDQKRTAEFAGMRPDEFFLLPYTTIQFTMNAQTAVAPFSAREGVVFLGAETLTNALSLRWFLLEPLFYIHQQLPMLPVYIAGDVLSALSPEEQKDILSIHKVQAVGRQSDPSALFNRVRVFVSPRILSSGMSTKNILAMQYSLPVVTTRSGAEGMPSWEGLPAVGNSPEEFADAVVALHENEQLWQHASSQGPAYVEKFFSVNASMNTVGELCARMAAINRRRIMLTQAGKSPKSKF